MVREAEGQEEVKEGDRSCNQLCKRASKIKYKKETDPQKGNSITVHWYPNELNQTPYAISNHFSYKQLHKQLASLPYLPLEVLSLRGRSVMVQNCNISNQ